MIDLKIKIVLFVFCLLVSCPVLGYEINGNTVTTTSDGGIKIELSNPMYLNPNEQFANPFFYQDKASLTKDSSTQPLIGWKILSNPDNYNLSPYLSYLIWNISINLYQYKFDKDDGELCVNVKILKDGSISDAKIVKSSWGKESEKFILDTLTKFKGREFPPEWGDRPIDICLLFETFKQNEYQQENLFEVDFDSYMKELRHSIKSNWDPPKVTSSKRISVLMTILKDGKLEKCRMFQSSGDEQSDKAALDAVNRAAPFKPLPQEYKGKSINVQYFFVANIYGTDNQDNLNNLDNYFKNFPRGMSVAELEPYLEKMRKCISSNLKSPIDYTSKPATILVKIRKDGELVNCRVWKSSGNEKIDKAIIDAVYKTAPFKPLPDKYNAEFLDFSFSNSSHLKR